MTGSGVAECNLAANHAVRMSRVTQQGHSVATISILLNIINPYLHLSVVRGSSGTLRSVSRYPQQNWAGECQMSSVKVQWGQMKGGERQVPCGTGTWNRRK